MGTDSGGTAPAAVLLNFLTAKWVAPALGAVARLGIADLLAAGPRTADDLATACGADVRALRRVLRALASVEVFVEDPAHRFALTPVAETLRTGVPGSMRSATIMATMEPMWAPYSHIMHSLRTGRPAFDEMYGMPVYEFLRTHPDEARIFGEAAAGFYQSSTPPLVAAYDYGRLGTLVDVGGGTGALLSAIVSAHPGLRGVLLDLPPMVEAARKVVADAGVVDRVSLVEGDFFASVPAGAGGYLVKSVLHSFDDADAIRLLCVLRETMPADATLLVVESVLPTGNAPHYAKLSDIELLTLAGGEERDADQWTALLAAGGFRIVRSIPAGDVTSILEAVPA